MIHYTLKVYAIFVNTFYIYTTYILNIFKKSKIKKILFSEKEWWDQLIHRGPFIDRFDSQFSKFELSSIHKFDLVVPLTIADLEFCILNENQLLNNPIPIPNIESFNICNDKGLFEKFMTNSGFSEYIPYNFTQMQFPFILKKKQDEGGENTFIISNDNDVESHIDEFNSIDYIKQNVIEGEKEYATHVIMKEGKILNALTIVYTFENSIYIKGKDKYICRNICKNKHNDLFEKVLKKMNYDGLCCINYKQTDGIPKIIEINPRFGGSLCDFFYPFIQKAS